LGDYDRPDNARKLNLVCDDRNPGLNYKDVGNLYGCRNWVEYGLNQSKNELGWADFRLTQYQDIEKWWEIVCSAYLLLACLPTCR